MHAENELTEEKKIKNAVIDLLHSGEEVTDSAIAKATGLDMMTLQRHNASIKSMLAKLKKARTPDSI